MPPPLTQSVESTDPLRIHIDITFDRATLTATLDEHLEVTSLEEATTQGWRPSSRPPLGRPIRRLTIIFYAEHFCADGNWEFPDTHQ